MVQRGVWRSVLCMLAAVALGGCPPGAIPARDGGRACSSVRDCNAGGATCGVVFDCVVGVCSDTTVVKACADGAYPGSDAATGECLVSEDCNPAGACGPIVACVNYVCDRDGPRINIPCADAETPRPDASAPDASVLDASAPDASPVDAGAADAARTDARRD